MTAKMAKSAISVEAMENPALAAFESWMTVNRPMVEAWTELNGKLIEQAAKVNNEWLGFMSRRLTEDLSFSQRFMDCKTLQDVMAVYADFYQRAQKQYQDEFRYFAELNQKMANETASVMRSHIEETTSALHH